jgi:hypothetical protein
MEQELEDPEYGDEEPKCDEVYVIETDDNIEQT